MIPPPPWQAELDSACSTLDITATTTTGRITELKNLLLTSMKKADIPLYTDLIQQWEDFAQFDSWTIDLHDTAVHKGHETIPSTGISSHKLTHPTIQMACGKWLYLELSLVKFGS